jgi:peptidoglycan hydrolase-like protein with peptidoglycan-binding domain
MKTKTVWGAIALSLALVCAPLALAGNASPTHANTAKAQATQDMAGYRNWSAQKMRLVQKALIEHGADIKATGQWNDETRVAIKAFQKKHDLNATGFPNKATVAELGVNTPQ